MYRHVAPIKEFAGTLLNQYGPQAYEFIKANLAWLPSLSNLQKERAQMPHVAGSVRVEELRPALKRLKEAADQAKCTGPCQVAEDGTRIITKLEWEQPTNAVHGFVLRDDEPTPLLTSYQELVDMTTTARLATIAYVFIASPLAYVPGLPPSTVVMLASDNRFDAQDVERRWRVLEEAFVEQGLLALHSSDGDPKLLSAAGPIYNAAALRILESG